MDNIDRKEHTNIVMMLYALLQSKRILYERKRASRSRFSLAIWTDSL